MPRAAVQQTGSCWTIRALVRGVHCITHPCCAPMAHPHIYPIFTPIPTHTHPPTHPRAGLRPVHVCHDTFQKLLSLTWDARTTPLLRPPLYVALLHYLLLCRPPALARLSPSALRAAVDGGARADMPGGVATLLDDTQRRLEAGNASLLLAGARLVEVVGRDAVHADNGGAVRGVLALQLLGEMVAAEPSGALADALHGSGLPVRLLQDLADAPKAALLQVGAVVVLFHVVLRRA